MKNHPNNSFKNIIVFSGLANTQSFWGEKAGVIFPCTVISFLRTKIYLDLHGTFYVY